MGPTIGGYTLVERLWRDGVSTTWAATRGDARFRVRVLERADARAAFLAVPDLIEGLPGFVRIVERGVAPEPFHVYEARGQILEEAHTAYEMRGARMPLAEALGALDGVLGALEACHARGLLHRRLGLSAVLLAADGAKLFDVGLPRPRERRGDEAHFMAPEVAMGLDAELDGRADVFSAGAVLATLLTGSWLYDASTFEETLVLHATSDARPLAMLASLPPSVRDLLETALAWDRRARFAGAREMREALPVSPLAS